MPGLVKATLADASDPKATEVEVQLNPTSLRFQQTNAVDGGVARGRQVQQFQGTSSTTVTMDLVFDTADEGVTGKARSVREKTRQVARFVLPAKTGSKQVPPRVRFAWGEFVLEGVMTGMTEDIDLFSPEGVPLRAKVSITISAQDPNFANLATGPGANRGASATAPGAGSAGLGSSGTANPDRTALALGGESAAEFSARVGLDPAAWRGVTAGLEGSLSLQAGAQIDFSADVSVPAGIGVSAGIEAGASGATEAALGLPGASPAGASGPGGGGGSSSDAGFALSAAGGVAAAAAAVATSRADAAAADARRAFGAGGPGGAGASPVGAGSAVGAAGSGARGGSPAGAGSPTPAGAAPTYGGATPATAGPTSAPTPDPRAVSFGYGVPLRPMVRLAAAERQARIRGGGRLAVRPGPDGGPVTNDPTVPPWIALPSSDPARPLADAAQSARRASSACGCGCGGLGGAAHRGGGGPR